MKSEFLWRFSRSAADILFSDCDRLRSFDIDFPGIYRSPPEPLKSTHSDGFVSPLFFDMTIEEIDDEHWVIPTQGNSNGPLPVPKQPEGVPSQISYFVAYLKLGQILAFALRTIYTINKSKVLLGFVGEQWEQHIVSELGGS